MVNLETANDPVNVFDLEKIAREKLPALAYDYYASGACDEITLAANISAYQEIWLRPRMLVDISNRVLETTALGTRIVAPLIVAPMAFQRMANEDGEIATALAAADFGTIMTVSTLSNYSIEEVAAGSPDANLWFQLYVYKDKAVTRDLVERAEAAGCKALVVTVDSPLLGRRERDVRNKFHLPEGLLCGNLIKQGTAQIPQDSRDSALALYIASLYDTSLTWKDIEWLKSITKLPLAVKGVLRGDDAERAIASGADSIIVSNHGGRQLDTTIPTIKALPEVVEAADSRVEIFVDGGVRRGTDIIKAIALGARAVLVGRPILWGLTVAGQSGVQTVLELLRRELDLSMGLAGLPSVSEITPDILYAPRRS